MEKRILFICASFLALSTQAQALSLFGTSTKEYVDRAIAVTNVQDTLAEIKTLNRTVMDKEKTISAMSAQLQKKSLDAVTRLEEKMRALLDEKRQETELNIKLLNEKKERREGNVAELEKAIVQEGSVLSYAKMANAASFGYLQSVVGWAKSWNDIGRSDIETSIGNLKREIANLEKEITAEKSNMQAFLTSPELQASQEKLSKKLTEARAALDNVLLVVNETRQKTIFTPHNATSDELIKKLNQSIKNAKCSGISTMNEAKDEALESCKAQYIEKIVKAKTKAPECAKLTTKATADALGACKKVL